MPSIVLAPMVLSQIFDGIANASTCRRSVTHTVLLVGEGTTEQLMLLEDYSEHFPKNLLDGQQADVPELGELLGCMSFGES